MSDKAFPEEAEATPPPLQPPPYQLEVLEYLKTCEPDLWRWFSSSRPQGDRSEEAVRLDLLKSTYRIEPSDAETLYSITREIIVSLGLTCSCTLYRAQNPQGLNVSIASIPGEAHIVFHGPVQETLSPEELRAVLAHELSHFVLYEGWSGELAVAEEILYTMATDQSADDSHLETYRLFRLYTEIFADRGAYWVTGDPLVAISSLLKLETGDREVRAESYLRQALEIFHKEAAQSEGESHPETFIRTYAIHLWAQSGVAADEAVRKIIEGPLRLSSLDLLGQQKALRFTRRLIEIYLAPSWIRTEPLLGHARLYFEDFSPPAQVPIGEALHLDVALEDSSLKDYFCYVLLDFVAIDRELEEAPLAAALELTKPLGLTDRFVDLARKELNISKAVIKQVLDTAPAILASASSQENPGEAR